jgi:hypothetical protein
MKPIQTWKLADTGPTNAKPAPNDGGRSGRDGFRDAALFA